MTKAFIYHRSHAHRVACLSLYRALLREVNNFSHSAATEGYSVPSAILQDLVRFRFRRDRKSSQSPGAAADALTIGNETLSVLRDAASLSPSAVSSIVSTLNTTSAEADLTAAWREDAARRTKPRPRDSIYQLRHTREISTKRLVTAPSRHESPDHKLRLERHPLPLLELSLRKGKRKRAIPHLVVSTTGQVPFLLYKTGQRQPAWLRRIHAQQVKATTRAFSQVEKLDYLRSLGKTEDDWDLITAAQANREGSFSWSKLNDAVGGWSSAAHEARQSAGERHAENMHHRAVKGWELFQIVKREKWMSQKESLPFKIASAIQNGQRLQEKILEFRDAKSGFDPGLSGARSLERSDSTSRQEDCSPVTDESPLAFKAVVDERQPDIIFAGPDADLDGQSATLLFPKSRISSNDDQRPTSKAGTASHPRSAPTPTTLTPSPSPSPSLQPARQVPTFNFTPRPKETSKSLIKASLALAPLIIPTEWSKKVVDREMPKYLQRSSRAISDSRGHWW